MKLWTTIRIFVFPIIFNVILPTGDVYSDIALMYQTWMFRNTDSLELVGCRACYNKRFDNLVPSTKDCISCVTKNRAHSCGNLPTTKKLLEIDNAKKCEHSKWGLLMKQDKQVLKSGKCDEEYECCIETTNKFSSFHNIMENKVNNYLDPRLLVDCNNYHLHAKAYNMIYYKMKLLDVCALFGQSSRMNCEENVRRPNERSIKSFLETNIDVFNMPDFVGQAYKFLIKNNSTKSLYAIAPFNIEKFNDEVIFECGILIKPKKFRNNVGVGCGMDICSLHLGLIYSVAHGINDLESWKSKVGYSFDNIRIGGKNCHLLRVYSLLMLIPVTINFLFSAAVFQRDLKSGVSSKYEVPFLFGLFYPQWRTLKILIKGNSAKGNGILGYSWNLLQKEEELINQLEENNRDVSLIEPFCESGTQVRNLLIFDIITIKLKYKIYLMRAISKKVIFYFRYLHLFVSYSQRKHYIRKTNWA